MIDFHSHILPGVDDGSKSVEISIEMLKRQAQQGITHVVCTPHFYPRYHRPRDFLERRDRAEALLREEMEKHRDLPQLLMGAEVQYFRGISNSDAIQQLTIRNKSCIMIEMVSSPWQSHMYEELAQIHRRWGVTPIIAHVDRYISPWRSYGIPERLQELPVLVQANAEFFLEKRTARMALRMLREGKIQVLGSDCHNLTDRGPNLGAALDVIQSRLGPDAVARLQRNSYEALGVEV